MSSGLLLSREIVEYLVAVMATDTNVEQFYPKVNGANAPFYTFFSKRVHPTKKGIPPKGIPLIVIYLGIITL